MTNIPTRWFDAIPKVELHVHLEGSIPLDTLWELVQHYGGDPSVPTRAALEQRFVYTDFAHFIEMWVWKNRYIRSLDDFTRIAEAVARDYAAQNIIYVEAHYSPTDFRALGFSIAAITAAIRTGLDRCAETTVLLICDVVRDSPIERALQTVHEVAALRLLGVVGIGLGGSEQSHPPEPFAPVFALARSYGLHTTVHAGEAAGPESIWGAINALLPERIGHAGRAVEDPALVEYYVAHNLALECCPLSNVRTNVYPSIAAHPVGMFIARGMCVTINTDDPKMFHNTLTDEYAALVDVYGLTRRDICRLIENAVDVSWLAPEGRAALHATLSTHPDWVRD